MRYLLVLFLAAVAWGQPREATCTITDEGGDDTYAGTCTAGTVKVRLIATTANAGACTLSIDGGTTPTAIKHGGTTDPASDTIPGSGKPVILYFDGTNWQIESSGGGAGGGDTTDPTNSGATGASVLKTSTNVVARKLKAGANVTVTENVDDIEIASTGGTATDPYDYIDLVDEFMGGANASAVVGDLGWSFTTGTVSSPGLASPTAGTWGFFRRNTAASASSFATTYLWNAGNMGFPSTGTWALTYRVKAGSTWDANTVVQIGASCASNLTTNPTNAIYFRLTGATTENWFTVTRSASTETANDSGIAIGTGWNKIVIRRIDASTIGFKIGTADETQHTTNIPSAQCNPWFSITNGITAATASLDVEFFRLTGTSGR